MSGVDDSKRRSSRATKQQLLNELERLQRRINELERSADQHQRVNQAQREGPGQFSLIVDHLPALISYVDSDQRYRFVNSAYEKWFGTSQREVEGRHVKEVLGEPAYQVLENYVTRALAGELVNYEAAVPYKEGGERHIDATYVPDFTKDGKVEGFFVLVHDITDRKRAEEALRKAHDELERRVEERTTKLNTVNTQLLGEITERKSAEERAWKHEAELARVLRRSTLGEMVSALAHELNQPLAAMAIFSDACLRKELSGTWKGNERRKELKQIHEQAVLAGQIMHRVRAFVQGSGHAVLPANLDDVVSEAINLLTPELRNKEVKLKVEYESNLPPVLVDVIEIEQVILNLVMNSIEALTETDKRDRELTITASMTDEDMVEVAIRDSGPGFPPGQVNQMFESFHTTKPEGMGMGLSISRTIAEAHGGRLWASHDGNSDLTFRFTLPICKEESSHGG